MPERRRTAAGDASGDATADSEWPPRCGVHASRGAQAEGLRLQGNGSGSGLRDAVIDCQFERHCANRWQATCVTAVGHVRVPHVSPPVARLSNFTGWSVREGPGASISNSPSTT